MINHQQKINEYKLVQLKIQNENLLKYKEVDYDTACINMMTSRPGIDNTKLYYKNKKIHEKNGTSLLFTNLPLSRRLEIQSCKSFKDLEMVNIIDEMKKLPNV
jgi:hypothetical protein